MTNLVERIPLISSKEDAADFIAALRDDLVNHKESWQNWTLEGYLESMEAWLRSMGDKVLEQPVQPATWRALAEVLHAGSIYE
jgi:hypothetical protein